VIIMITSFTKRLLIKLGQRSILSDKPLDKLHVTWSLILSITIPPSTRRLHS
jgi:hypothetical protein